MQEAVGAIIISNKSKRILLNKRSNEVTYPNYWGFIGGKVEDTENPLITLHRELFEEIKLNTEDILQIQQINVFNSNNNFTYYSFIVYVQDEFVPILNNESCGYAWITFNNWPQLLHPGASTVLESSTVQELYENQKAL